MGPPALNNMLEAYIPNHELRFGDQLLVNITRCNTEFACKNIRVRGGYYWNSFTQEIKAQGTTDLFKQKMKRYNGLG